MSEIRRVSDIIGAPQLEGERTDIHSILNKEVIIRNIIFLQGNYGEYAIIQVETDDKKLYRIACGGQVVIKKLHAIRDFLPVMGKFIRVKGSKGRSYYDIE